MTGRRWTALFILFWLCVLAAYDVFAACWWGEGATITGQFRGAGAASPWYSWLFAFLLGCLFGHFFLCPTDRTTTAPEKTLGPDPPQLRP